MLSSYDRWRLDNGETRSKGEYEPEKEIALPLDCQKCEVEYEIDEPGATYGFCPKCNGVDDSPAASPNRDVHIASSAVGSIGEAMLMFSVAALIGLVWLFAYLNR